jgi:hypothetical protein
MDKAFDASFSAMMAWNQIGLIAGGLAMLLIGGLLIFWFFNTRLTYQRVKGKIVGVRVTGIKDGADPPPTPEAPQHEASWENFGTEFRKSPGTGIAALFVVFLVVGIPLVFIGFGAFFACNYISLSTHGIQTEGIVTGSQQESDSDGGTMYYALVSFKDETGKSWEVKDNFGKGGSPIYEMGEHIAVHYEPGNPEHIIAGGFAKNMALPGIFIGMGVAVLFFIFGGSAVFKGKAKPSALPKRHKPNYSSEMYHPVFEYKARDGTTIKGEGNTSSNWLGDKLPGQEVMLYIRSNAPDDINTPGMLGLVFGLVFTVPGAVMMYYALTKFEFNIFSALFGLGLLLYCGLKFKKIIRPRDQWLTKESFAALKKEKRKKKRGEGRLLTAQEIRERVQAQDRAACRWTPFLALAAVVMITGGVYLGQDMKVFLSGAKGTKGEVIRIENVYNHSSDGNSYTYYPVVEFRAENNDTHQFRDRVGSNPSFYQPGDSVNVLYDPTDLNHAMVDRGLWNWMLAAGLSLGGFMLLWSALKTSASISSRRSRI